MLRQSRPWVGLTHGLGWVGSHKMDPWTTLCYGVIRKPVAPPEGGGGSFPPMGVRKDR